MSPDDRLRRLAAVAAQGIAPSVSAVADGPASGRDGGRWRIAVARLRAAGLLAWPDRPVAAAGTPAPLWPGPSAWFVLTPEELEAWERCRDMPSPDSGWVSIYAGGEGDVRRVVDGVALAFEPREEDVRLLRGGVAVGVVSGARFRWEVVDGR